MRIDQVICCDYQTQSIEKIYYQNYLIYQFNENQNVIKLDLEKLKFTERLFGDDVIFNAGKHYNLHFIYYKDYYDTVLKKPNLYEIPLYNSNPDLDIQDKRYILNDEGSLCFRITYQGKTITKEEDYSLYIISATKNIQIINQKINFCFGYDKINNINKFFLSSINLNNIVNVFDKNISYDFSSAFYKERYLKTLSGFDTLCENLTISNLDGCFYDCESLTNINHILSNISLSNVYSLHSCFYGCGTVQSLDLSNIRLSNNCSPSALTEAFYGTNFTQLTSQLQYLDFTNLQELKNTFAFCNFNDETVNLSNKNFSNIRNMEYCFYQTKANIINLSQTNLSNVENFSYCFGKGGYKLVLPTNDLLSFIFDAINNNNANLSYAFGGDLTDYNNINYETLMNFFINKIKTMSYNLEFWQCLFYGANINTINGTNLHTVLTDDQYCQIFILSLTLFSECNINNLILTNSYFENQIEDYGSSSYRDFSNVTFISINNSIIKNCDLSHLTVDEYMVPVLTDCYIKNFNLSYLQTTTESFHNALPFHYHDLSLWFNQCAAHVDNFNLSHITFKSTNYFDNITALPRASLDLSYTNIAGFKIKSNTNYTNLIKLNHLIEPLYINNFKINYTDEIDFSYNSISFNGFLSLSSKIGSANKVDFTSCSFSSTDPYNDYYILFEGKTSGTEIIFGNNVFGWRLGGLQFEDLLNEVLDLSSFTYTTKSSYEKISVLTFEGCHAKTIIFPTVDQIECNIDYCNLFENCTELQNINFNNNINEAYLFDGMFKNCKSLTSNVLQNILNQLSFNNDSISINQMFYGCQSLTSLNLSFLSEIVVQDFYGVFSYCSNLSNIIFPHFILGDNFNDISFSEAFAECESLTSIDMSQAEINVNRSGLMDLYRTFRDCKSLVSFSDVLFPQNFDRTKVKSITGTFSGCSSLTSVNLNGFSNVVGNYAWLFSGCSSLTSVDMTGLPSATNLESCFSGCSSLQNIKLPSLLRVNNESSMNGAFGNCISLKTIHLPDFSLKLIAKDYEQPPESGYMHSELLSTPRLSHTFYNCYNLTTISINNRINEEENHNEVEKYIHSEYRHEISDTCFYNCLNLSGDGASYNPDDPYHGEVVYASSKYGYFTYKSD